MKWYNYPEETPNKQGIYLVELDNGELKELQWDYVWGWCGDFDDYDQPHFLYDWDCKWSKIEGREY